MQKSNLLSLDPTLDYSTKEFGPIVVALGFVIALGGITAAAVAICGWGHIRSASINWSKWSAEIICR